MKTYYTAHAVALNKTGEILVLKRASHRTSPGKWNCVTGFVQERESAEEAAMRELKEESNLEGNVLASTEPFWKEEGDTRWVVVASLINVSDISDLKIDANESSDYKWIKPSDPLIADSKSLQISLTKLGVLK